MKKRRLFFLWLMAPLLLFAQEKSFFSLQPIVEYGYNYTHQNYGCVDVLADFRVANNVSLHCGLQGNTANLYSVVAKGTIDFPLKKGALFIENRYLYKAIVRNNIQELNMGISLGYRATYWKIQGGYCNRFFTQLVQKNKDLYSIVFQPFGVMYLIEANVFKPEHTWNIGGRVSNFDYFIMERIGYPIFTLFCTYSLNKKCQWITAAGVRPSGITNGNANFWGFFLQSGITLSW